MKIKVTMFRDDGEPVHEQVHDASREVQVQFDRRVIDGRYEHSGYLLSPLARPVHVVIDPDGTMEKIILELYRVTVTRQPGGPRARET